MSASAGEAGPAAAHPLTRQVASRAAEWFVLIQSGECTPRQRGEFETWLAHDPAHARAWQRAIQVSDRAGSVPPALGSPALRRPRNRREAVRSLMLLMAAAPVGWLAWRLAPWQQWSATHATATGEQRDLLLPDGSRVWLDTASAIDIDFDDTQRLVWLRSGAVLIETARDPGAATGSSARPFLVRTTHGSARAIGTRFIVRDDAQRSQVAVLQGAVEVKTGDGREVRRLQAGQQLGFDASRIEAVRPADPFAGQWARGVLAVDDMRLDSFAAELSRYRSGLLRCEAAVAGLRITGAFQLDDTDAVLRNVARLLPVQVLYRTRYWVTLAPRGATG
ncbi:FecR domain-containing protein [Variovorax saccharolyticus]|uniref:FecR domain-containing protein n=1 Tax=Variovorax saccharolyticus TaxID=3053516 RepID=UPI0025754E72|nr:FecR domain-containing protein [Variovorax sp. J22R187]MDM0019342.1 FecR domain-containing protein [Variovorax sp. J22R187]